ncbi:MAG TPA: hypothetical protein VHN59_00340 [Chitinophagaceae bacterium]|nr:hypothetical protein [Chitinophagaceae bacterium]
MGITELSAKEQQELKAMQIVFVSITTAALLFLLGAIVFSQSHGPLAPGIKTYYSWLLGGAAIFSFACSIWGRQQFARGVETAKTSLNPLEGKLTMYRTSLIVYLAITELPIIFCIILSLLTGNFVFQVYAAVLIGFMLPAMPRKEKVISQLQ